MNAQISHKPIKWLSVSLRAGYGNTIFRNYNIRNDNNVTLDYFSPSYSASTRVGITIGDRFGIFGEYGIFSYSQKYEIRRVGQYRELYNKKINILATEYAFLIKITGYYGLYLEFGPKFTTPYIMKEENTHSFIEPDEMNFFSETDTTYNMLDDIKEQFGNYVIGIGYTPIRKDRFEVSFGLRICYAFEDLYDENGRYPYPLYDGVYNERSDYENTYIDDYKETRLLTLQMMFEMRYVFGFWGNQRRNRGKLVLFR